MATQQAVGAAVRLREDLHDKLVILFDALSASDLSRLEPFREGIAGLQTSPNIAVRKVAWQLSERLGQPSEPRTHPKSLPLVYTMEVPPLPDLHFETEIEVGEVLRNPNDPRWDLLSYVQEFELVARVAGLNSVNVFHRAQQLMHTLVPEGRWSREAEAKLRQKLRRADLEFPYIRPKALVARRAFCYLVAELYDAAVLDDDQLRSLSRLLRYYDPEMTLLRPAPRSAFIRVDSLTGRRNSGRRGADWLENVGSTLVVPQLRVADRFVLAEDTTLRLPGLDQLKEHRRTVVGKLTNATNEAGLPVGSFHKALVADYREAAERRRAPFAAGAPLAVRQSFRWFDTPGTSWLALNPVVGCALGWHLAENGLFRWVDRDGELMAESVWWKDGEIEGGRSPASQPVGEGWLVLATQPGWAHLTEVGLVTARWIHVEREQVVDSGVQSRVAAKIERIAGFNT